MECSIGSAASKKYAMLMSSGVWEQEFNEDKTALIMSSDERRILIMSAPSSLLARSDDEFAGYRYFIQVSEGHKYARFSVITRFRHGNPILEVVRPPDMPVTLHNDHSGGLPDLPPKMYTQFKYVGLPAPERLDLSEGAIEGHSPVQVTFGSIGFTIQKSTLSISGTAFFLPVFIVGDDMVYPNRFLSERLSARSRFYELRTEYKIDIDKGKAYPTRFMRGGDEYQISRLCWKVADEDPNAPPNSLIGLYVAAEKKDSPSVVEYFVLFREYPYGDRWRFEVVAFDQRLDGIRKRLPKNAPAENAQIIEAPVRHLVRQ
jgi:hypothetical protein